MPLFVPLNHRYPSFKIENSNFAKQLHIKKEEIEQYYYSGVFVGWQQADLDPTIKITKVKGKRDNITLNTQILLDVYNVEQSDFTAETKHEVEELEALLD